MDADNVKGMSMDAETERYLAVVRAGRSRDAAVTLAVFALYVVAFVLLIGRLVGGWSTLATCIGLACFAVGFIVSKFRPQV